MILRDSFITGLVVLLSLPMMAVGGSRSVTVESACSAVTADGTLATVLTQAREALSTTAEGTDPGYYSKASRSALQEAIDTATQSAPLQRALQTYRNSENGVQLSTPASGTWYQIMSGPSVSYCEGKVIYDITRRAGQQLHWDDPATDSGCMWKLVDAGGGLVYIVNCKTGYYMHATTTSGSGSDYTVEKQSDASRFTLQSLHSQGAFLFYAGPSGNPVHADQHGTVVTWNSRTLGTASCWRFRTVTAERQAQAMASDSAYYKLVWSDEFNTDGKPNTANWNYEKGFVRNHESQWYQADNAVCRDGCLVIEGRAERKANPNYVAGSTDWKKSRQYIDYTSSSLNTSGKHAFTYGRYEMRAKIPVSGGAWPAFWTLGYGGTAGEWPSCGEIDIMEYYTGGTLANVAWAKPERWSAYWDMTKTALTEQMKYDAKWKEEFHVWRMDWDKEAIKLYLDDRLMNVTNLSNTVNEAQGTWSKVANPFYYPQYILVNLAMGGDNGGTIDAKALPMEYYIDYVRVSQKAQRPDDIRDAVSSHPKLTGGRGHYTLDMAGLTGSRVSIRLYDLSGRCLYRSVQQRESSIVPIRMEGLTQGSYILSLSDGQQRYSYKICN